LDEKIKGKKIMVVDDESDLTLFFSMSLEYYGFVPALIASIIIIILAFGGIGLVYNVFA
jgi:hypothetical protein